MMNEDNDSDVMSDDDPDVDMAGRVERHHAAECDRCATWLHVATSRAGLVNIMKCCGWQIFPDRGLLCGKCVPRVKQ